MANLFNYRAYKVDMIEVTYIKTIWRSALSAAIVLLLLAPQLHTICSRDCRETEAPACSCHNDQPSHCEMEGEKPATPWGCDCGDCIEVQLPEEFCTVAPIPHPTRYDQVDFLAPNFTPSTGEQFSPTGYYLSPLNFANRFLSQSDDRLACTVIIS